MRSFVRRSGRATRAQRRALETLWPRYGVERRGRLDLDAAFGRSAPRVLEVGFGMGDTLADAAAVDPGRDFLGVEMYEPGIGRLLARLEAEGIGNVRVLREDAAEVLGSGLEPGTLDEIWIYFPDPWPKKRHHKRRLVQPDFAARARDALRSGGTLRLATDWEDYARHMVAVLDVVPGLASVAGAGRFMQGPAGRAVTKFERRGRGRGHGVWDLAYERVG